jgi:hypothetical protein
MRKLLAILITAAIVVGPASTAVAQVSPDINCPGLTRAQAQAIYDADPTDPNNLDGDGDGLACEANEGASGAGSTSATGFNPLRRDVGYDATTDRTFQLTNTISPPHTGNAGIR